MKILVTGSSGFIGQHVTARLKDEGHDVIAASRKTGVDFNVMLETSDWLPHLEAIDVVINCVGIIAETRQQRFNILHTRAPAALFKACEQVGVTRVIQMSALITDGTDEKSFTPYQLSKKAADDVLRNLSIDWFILRPSLVYGEGGESTRFFKMLAKLPLLALVSGGRQKIQPVHIMDLVDVVSACLTAQPARRTIDVVGPQAMTFAQWIQRLRQQTGKGQAFIIPLPYKGMLLISYLLNYWVPLLHPDNLRMLQQGNFSNDKSMMQLLGRAQRDVP